MPRWSHSLRVRLLAATLGTAVIAVPLGVATYHATRPSPGDRAATLSASIPAAHTFRRFTSTAQFAAGTHSGTQSRLGSLVMADPTASRTYRGTTYDTATWLSPLVEPGQSFTQMVPSWNAVTPDGTWMEVWARARTNRGELTGWKSMARWSTRDAGFQRTTDGSQPDELARVGVDTVIAQPGVRFVSWQLRIDLQRLPDSTNTPEVRALGVISSTLPSAAPATSRPLLGGKILPVPQYSQMIHRGQYPQYGGGGEAWCSPTSLAMLLGYYRTLPSATNYAWVDRSYADPWVDHVARLTYDYGYHGTGNWPFNTGYAAAYLPDTFVTRLYDLREAERFIAAGIPLAVSISFPRGGLTGAPISSTDGHLVVIVGFTAAGKVVVNDPAAPDDRSVRRIYDRGQLERAWINGSGGTAYVVRDAAHPLPARGASTSW